MGLKSPCPPIAPPLEPNFTMSINQPNILKIQYTLANPNRGVPIQKISVPITEFVRISEIALVSIWRINNTKICGNPLLLV